jgi:AraC-like DNA-binding protein/mannose-6-phosphate isomerase-like protein (cupin superfamily)
MKKTIETRNLKLKEQPICEIASEQVCCDDQLAHDVARPLFTAGINIAAIAERKVYDTRLFSWPCHNVRIILQGKLRVETDTNTYNLNPGDLIVMPVGVRHRYVAGTGGMRHLYFWIRDLPEWAGFKKNTGYVRTFESSVLVYLLLREILDAKASHQPTAVALSRENARHLVRLLQLEMTQGEQENTPQAKNLQSLLAEITQTPGEDWGRSILAEKLSCSVSHVTRIFQKHLGVSPGEFITRQRMHMATLRLINTDLIIETIAAEAGYTSLHSFTRLFTKHIGMPPGQYRTQFRQLRIKGL